MFLILDSISITLHQHHNYKAFECSSVTLKLPSSTLTVFNIYRPPTLSKYAQPISVFLDEFQTVLSFAVTTPHEFIITGDFNIHLDDHLDSSSQQLTGLLSSTNLIQHVSVSTHTNNHHLNSLSLLLTQIELQQYHNLLSLYLITFLFALTSTLHSHLPHTLLNLPSVAPKTLISSNSISTSLHPT